MGTKEVFRIFVFLVLISSCKNTNNQNNLTFCSWGGEYQKAQREAYIIPFQKKFDVFVKETSYSGELSRIKSMVDNKKVEWDVVSVTQEMFSTGNRYNLFEDIDYSNIDTTSLIKGANQKKGVAHLVFSTVLAYNSAFYKNKPKPNSWMEFWNIEKFPGTRSLRDSPIGNLEFALLADGVPMDKLYPLDIGRAFKKLTEIKPHIKVWWKQGQQPIQLLSSGEVQLATGFNGRLTKAKFDGEMIDIEWNGGMLEPEYFVIIKGSSNKKSANKLISYALQSNQQASFVKIIPYGPTNLDAFNFLPDSLKEELPDSPKNIKNQFLINGEWWATNYESVLEMWNKWKLSN